MSEFAELTVAEICGTLPEVSISSALRHNKSHLLSELEHFPEVLKAQLRSALQQKRTAREASREATLTRRAEKRRRDTEVHRERRVRQCRELRREDEEHDTSPTLIYLQKPSDRNVTVSSLLLHRTARSRWPCVLFVHNAC